VYEVGDTVVHMGRVWRATAPSSGAVPAHGGPWAQAGVSEELAHVGTRGNPHVMEVGP